MPTDAPDLERSADAWWSPEDNEWVHGARDDQGRLTGLIRYWHADGFLVSECEHLAGVPHGDARRWFADGSPDQECRYEHGRIEGVRVCYRPRSGDGRGWWTSAPPNAEVREIVYDAGDYIGSRTLDAAGTEIGPSGQPVPPRPDGVTATAEYGNGMWIYARREGEDGRRWLERREWTAQGRLLVSYADGYERGYHPDGGVRCEGPIAETEDSIGRRAGQWTFREADGFVRRESFYADGDEYHRVWYRRPDEAAGRATVRSGPVVEGDEIGKWATDAGETVHLGHRRDSVEVLASPAVTAADPEAVPVGSDPGGPEDVVRLLRWAGRNRDPGLLTALTRDDVPWPYVDSDGESGVPMRYRHNIAAWLPELHWGRPLGPAAAQIAGLLLTANRPAAALDLVDLALCLGDDDRWQVLRVECLRAAGRDDDADAAVAEAVGIDRVDPPTEGLLLAIRADPDADAPRLAYADAVATTHPAHAALIRAQCAGEPGDLPADAVWHGAQPVRGFVPDGRLHLDAADFLRRDDALFRMAPEAVHLTLSHAASHLAEVARRPAMRRFHGLTLRETQLFDAGPVAALAGSRYLGRLRTLELRDTYLDDERLAIMLAGDAYPQLEYLDLSDSRLEQEWTVDGLRALPAARFAAHLVSLAIGGRHLDDDVVDILAWLPRLEVLDIHASALTDSGLHALAALDHRYHYLDIARGAFTATGAAALIASPVTAHLTYLNLSSNDLGDEGYASVVEAIGRTGLIDLDLSGDLSDPAGPVTARALARAPITDTLRRLNLSLAQLGADGATALAAAPWANLESLNLYGNGIGDHGAAAIAASRSLHRLRILDLGNNAITDTGALALASSPHLRTLTVVELGGAELTEATISVLNDRFGDGARLSYPWARRS